MADESNNSDIPVWFNGTQRWMTGLTKRTTCDDVIYALLVNTGLHETESTDNFAIFEKWREVERPLSTRTKILKVWSSWGEEQPNVQLSMRSLDDYFLPGESSLYMRSRRRHRKSNRNRDRLSTHCKCHRKRDCTECSRLRSLEQLVKMVVSQERKLQDLKDRILDTDTLIATHESRIHMQRVQQNGLDYVQNCYLNSHSSDSSTSSNESSSFSSLDSRDVKTIFWGSSFQELDEITRVCDKMANVDNRILQERGKIRELTLEVEKLSKTMSHTAAPEGETNASVEEARVQMIRAVTVHVTNELTERELDRRLDISMGELALRKEFMEQIEEQVNKLDRQKERTGEDKAAGNHGNADMDPKITHTLSSDISLEQPVSFTQRTDYHDYGSDLWPVSTRRLPIQVKQHSSAGNMNNHNNDSPKSVRSFQSEKDSHMDKDSHTDKDSYMDKDSHMDISQPLNGKYIPPATVRFSSFESHADGHKLQLDNRSKFAVCEAPTSRDILPVRKSKDAHQQPRLYSRSRSAERSSVSKTHREWLPGVCSLEGPRQYECNSGSTDRSNKGASPEFRTNSARDIVCHYGLELGSSSKRGNVGDSFVNQPSLLPNKFAITESDQQNRCKHQQHSMQVDKDCEFKHRGQKQHSQRWKHEWSPYTDNGNFVSENTISDGGANSNQRSGSGTFSHVYPAYFRESLNTQERDKTRDAQSTSQDTSDEPDVGMQGLGETVVKSMPQFEKDMSGLTQVKCCNSVQRKMTNTENEQSSTVNKPYNMDSVTARYLSTEFKQRQSRGQDMTFVTSISQPVRATAYERQQMPQDSGTKGVESGPAPRSPGVIFQDRQTADSQSLRQTLNPRFDRQTSTEQMKQNEVSQSVGDNNFINAWSNTNYNSHHSDCHRYDQDKNLQEASPHVSSFYSSSNTNSKRLRTPVNNAALNTIWSESSEILNTNKLQNGSQNFSTSHCHSQTIDPQSYGEYRYNSHNSPKMRHDSEVGQTNLTKDKNANPSSINAAKTSAANSKVPSPSLTSMKTSTLETFDDVSVDRSTNRGALYHIVSNKMNKIKSELKPSSTSSATPSNLQSDHTKSNATLTNTVGQHSGKAETPALHTHFAKLQQSSRNVPFPLRFSETSNDMRTTLQSRFYETDTDTQKNDFEQTMYNMNNRNNILSTNVFIQNSINQNKEYGLECNGILRNEYAISKTDSPRDLENKGFIFNNTDTVKMTGVTTNNNNRYTGAEHYSQGRGYTTQQNLSTSGHMVQERTKIDDISDSNSDTGLSSMHSDEATNIETLV